MKVKYNLAQFMAAAEYLSKYNDYIDKSPFDWLAKMDRVLQDAAREGSNAVSTGGFEIVLYRQGLDTDDLVAEVWVDPHLWGGGDDYDFYEIRVKTNDNRQRTAEANSVEAA